METKELLQLIESVTKTLNAEGFEHISLNHEGTALTLNKKSVGGQTVGLNPTVMAAPATTPTPNTSVGDISDLHQRKSEPAPVVESANFRTIESPIVGTFYNASSPEADPYVHVGSKVNKGDVVCIIEAMKLMNEIEAEESGEIVEICVVNEGPVEYGQVLFKIKAL